jgi:hypothetical protein
MRIIVTRVSKEWQRLIDTHRTLLTRLDFSDVSLKDKITTSTICNIIKRSGQRCHEEFAIWNHTSPLVIPFPCSLLISLFDRTFMFPN